MLQENLRSYLQRKTLRTSAINMVLSMVQHFVSAVIQLLTSVETRISNISLSFFLICVKHYSITQFVHSKNGKNPDKSEEFCSNKTG